MFDNANIIRSFALKKMAIPAFNDINSLDYEMIDNKCIYVNSYYHYHIENTIKNILENLQKNYDNITQKYILKTRIENDLKEINMFGKNPLLQIITKNLYITDLYQCTTQRITKEYYNEYYNIHINDDIIDYQGCSLQRLIFDIEKTNTDIFMRYPFSYYVYDYIDCTSNDENNKIETIIEDIHGYEYQNIDNKYFDEIKQQNWLFTREIKLVSKIFRQRYKRYYETLNKNY